MIFEFFGYEQCPNLGYLSSSMGMFDRLDHELAAYQWLEYRIDQDALISLLQAFPRCPSLAHAAIAFTGSQAQVMACEQIEIQVNLTIMQEFWDRFLYLIIDRNTIVLL
jgi:hypothetical protein